MRLPSKVTTYRESIIPLFPAILMLLDNQDRTVLSVFLKLKNAKWKDLSAYTFIQALDCLMFLGKIELKENMLHYAGRNKVR